MPRLISISFFLMVLLSSCAPAVTPAPTQADTLFPTQTVTPTARITFTPSPSPEPSATATKTPIDIFNVSDFPPEMQNYVNTFPGRAPAETGSSMEATYLSEDKTFHNGYLDYMKLYLKGIGVDTSSIEAFSGADWENYDNAVKAYELLWQQLAQNPENYDTNWILTPWFLRGDGITNLGMYDPENFVRSIDGGYGISNTRSEEDFIKDFPGSSNLQEAMIAWQLKIADYGYKIPISGIITDVLRYPLSAQTYGVLTAIADHPAYPDGSVKILIMGFQDKNGKWVYQPFAVNLAKKQTSSYDYVADAGGVHPSGEGFNVRVAGNAPSGAIGRFEYDTQKLIDLINHGIGGIPDNRYVDINGNDIRFSQFMLHGIETFGTIYAGGEATTSPLSP